MRIIPTLALARFCERLLEWIRVRTNQNKVAQVTLGLIAT